MGHYDILKYRQNAIRMVLREMGHMKYGDDPYFLHLSQVEGLLLSHGASYGNHTGQLAVAALLHDIIEDTGTTYNDVKKATNQYIADVVYDVTDSKGRNRKERHAGVAEALRKNQGARIVKLADRLANMLSSEGRMARMYVEEYVQFRNELTTGIEEALPALFHIEEALWASLETRYHELFNDLYHGVK